MTALPRSRVLLEGLNRNSIEEPLGFGKHRNASLREVAEEDPGYINWMLSQRDHFFVDRVGRDTLFKALNAAAVDKINAREEMTLTDHQQEIVDSVLDDLSDQRIVRLEGGAGYGKSYATRAVAEAMIRDGYQVRAAAVSYVATQVLAQQLEPSGIECGTMARTWRMDKLVDEQTGQDVYELSDASHELQPRLLGERQLLIVDECSMINDEHGMYMMQAVNRHQGKLLLVGDAKQLPPVKQPTISVCSMPWQRNVSELTVPMRYSKESHLYAVEQLARNNPYQLLSGIRASDEVACLRDRSMLIHDFVERYQADPTALHRMLLFRRKDVNAANNQIRHALHGDDAGLIVDDEQLMIMATTDTPYDANDGEGERYYSGQIFRCASVEHDTYEIDIAGRTFVIPHARCKFVDRPTPLRVMFAITETSADTSKPGGAEYTAALNAAFAYGNELRDAQQAGDRRDEGKPWRYVQQLKSDFVPVAYCYATTTHRAQGQTCDYAYTVPAQLLGVSGIMGQALAYVACTRARKHLSIVA